MKFLTSLSLLLLFYQSSALAEPIASAEYCNDKLMNTDMVEGVLREKIGAVIPKLVRDTLVDFNTKLKDWYPKRNLTLDLSEESLVRWYTDSRFPILDIDHLGSWGSTNSIHATGYPSSSHEKLQIGKVLDNGSVLDDFSIDGQLRVQMIANPGDSHGFLFKDKTYMEFSINDSDSSDALDELGNAYGTNYMCQILTLGHRPNGQSDKVHSLKIGLYLSLTNKISKKRVFVTGNNSIKVPLSLIQKVYFENLK